MVHIQKKKTSHPYPTITPLQITNMPFVAVIATSLKGKDTPPPPPPPPPPQNKNNYSYFSDVTKNDAHKVGGKVH